MKQSAKRRTSPTTRSTCPRRRNRPPLNVARPLQTRTASVYTLSASARTSDRGEIAAAQRFSQIRSPDALPMFEKSRLVGLGQSCDEVRKPVGLFLCQVDWKL